MAKNTFLRKSMAKNTFLRKKYGKKYFLRKSIAKKRHKRIYVYSYIAVYEANNLRRKCINYYERISDNSKYHQFNL